METWDNQFKKSHFKEIAVASFAKSGAKADVFMKKYHKDIKINQLRNFFGEIKSIQRSTNNLDDGSQFEDRLALLEMNLAYDYGRNVITKEFYELLTKSLGKISSSADFSKFVTFIKSLIAYHKFHAKGLGGNDA